MAYHSSVGCDLGGDQPTGYATPSACFHTPEITITQDLGITVSYWESLDAIRQWKKHAEHQEAQRLGRQEWYASFRVRVAKVEREYGV